MLPLSFFPGARFVWLWAKLTLQIFNIILFSLKIKVVIEPCDISMLSIDLLLHISFVWSCHCSITSSWHLSMNCVVIIIDILTSFRMWIEFHDEKYHPCPSIICVVIDNILALFPTQTWSCVGYILKFLTNLEIDPCVFLWSSNPIFT